MNKCPNCNQMVEVQWKEPQDDHEFIYGMGLCPMCKTWHDGMDWQKWKFELENAN